MSDGQWRERAGMGKQRFHVGGEGLMRRGQREARSNEHEQVTLCGYAGPAAPDDLPQPAPRTIALHRPAHTAFAGDESHAAGFACRREHQQQATAPAVGHPIAAHASEVAPTGQSIRRQQPLGGQIAHPGGGYGAEHRGAGDVVASNRGSPIEAREAGEGLRRDCRGASGPEVRSGTAQRSDDTVRRLRPCLRRAAITFRPPFVLMRARKPWVLNR